MSKYINCPDYKQFMDDKKNNEQIYFEFECCYPYYGAAPHTHAYDSNGNIIVNSLKTKGKSHYPNNFSEDSESPGFGVYDCPYNNICGGI